MSLFFCREMDGVYVKAWNAVTPKLFMITGPTTKAPQWRMLPRKSKSFLRLECFWQTTINWCRGWCTICLMEWVDFTLQEYRRRGYAALVTLSLSKRVAQCGFVPFVNVDTENVVSRTFFWKYEIQIVSACSRWSYRTKSNTLNLLKFFNLTIFSYLIIMRSDFFFPVIFCGTGYWIAWTSWLPWSFQKSKCCFKFYSRDERQWWFVPRRSYKMSYEIFTIF